ncbi:hypothetical protein ACHAQA_002431 [Verticillium albo-atrum]
MSSEDAIEWVEDPDAPNNGPTVNIAVWCLVALATVFLSLRVYCKFRRHKGLWWDDYTLIASWVFFVVAACQLSVNIAHGFGKPGTNINPEYSYQVGLGGLIVGTAVLIAPVLGKTSFILTLSRISGPKLTIGLWVIAASMAVFQTAALLVQWIQCTPLEKVWRPFMDGGSCWPYDINLGLSMGSAAYSGVVDLALAAVPWIVLKDLQIAKKEKIGIAVAMSMGVVAAATAFVKCVKLKILASSDFTLEGGELVIWASTEISTTIVAASIPILRTLVREISTARGSGAGYLRSTSYGDGAGRMAHQSRQSRANRPRPTSVGHVSPDEASDKSILENNSGGGRKAAISEDRTRDCGASGDAGYEMHRFGQPSHGSV